MKKIVLLISIWVALLALKANAIIVYVDSSHAGGTQTGTSWATAFSRFQNGVDAAHAGDSVWIAKGTYLPHADSSFHMKEGVKILGGFLNTATAMVQRDPSAYPTLLKGNGSSVIINEFNQLTNDALIDGCIITNGTATNGAGMLNYGVSPVISNCVFTKNTGAGGLGIFNSNGSAAYIVNCVFDSNTANTGVGWVLAFGLGIANDESDARIINCTFMHNSCLDGYGGGIYNSRSQVLIKGCYFSENSIGEGLRGGAIGSHSSSNIIDNCFFFHNSAQWYGGGVEMYGDSNSTVRHCTFKNNTGTYGGGLAIVSSQAVTVEHNFFEGNTASGVLGRGGAICNFNDSSKISDCIFIGNRATSGGAIANASGQGSVFANCLFAGNIADSMGGAAYNSQRGLSLPTSYRITNCSFIKNRSLSASGECFYNDSLTKLTIDNTISWGNTGGIVNFDTSASYTATYSLLQQEPANALLHNLDGTTDPLFADTVNGDYRLRFDSPCINAGTNTALPFYIVTDLAGNDRIAYSTVDMGVLEYKLMVELGNDTAICSGATQLILYADNAGSSYLWNTGDTTRSITVNGAGTYTVEVSNIWGDVSDTITISFGTPPLVDLGDDVTTNMSSYVLDAANPGAAYWWNTGATTQAITVTASGLYKVRVTNAEGCSAGDSVTVTLHPTGIADPAVGSADINISPNPASDAILINIDKASRLLYTTATLTNAGGSVLKTFVLKNKTQPCSLSGLPSGLYFLRIAGGGCFKIIKQ